MGSLPERHRIPVPAYHDNDTKGGFLNSLSGSSAKALSNDVVENTTNARSTRDILFTGSSLGVNRGDIPSLLQAWELFGSVILTFGINVIWQWNVKLLSLSIPTGALESWPAVALSIDRILNFGCAGVQGFSKGGRFKASVKENQCARQDVDTQSNQHDR